MKKAIAILLALTLALALVACGTTATTEPAEGAPEAAPEAAAGKVDAIKAAGKLVVGTSADFSPYEFHILQDGKDVIVGFDMALAQAIADELGVELEIVDMSFDSILTDLSVGSVDLGIAGFSPDPERAETVDFSELYYEGGQSFAINKANADKYDSYDDFAGLQVGAQTGSIQADLLAANCPDCQPVLLQKVPDIILELIDGKIEGAFIETVVLESYAKNYPDLMQMCDVEYDTEGSAVAIAKGNDDLTELVNKVIADSIANGNMAQWVADANALADQSISG